LYLDIVIFSLQDGHINRQQSVLLQSRQLELLNDLRPNAVALVDAFDFPDGILDSALGRFDGKVYEAMYDYALRSKLNEKQVRLVRSKVKSCPERL
jgi:acyl-CoA oxidase